jgi:ribosomal protein L22
MLSPSQIDGFKLHVLHNKQPFKNRIRYAPEVASRPDILEKDLDRARTLLVRLEAEYYALRKIRILSRDEVVALPEGPLQEDMVTLVEGEEDRDDHKPPRSILPAIEQRIEKAYAETPHDGLDEDDLKIRKVRWMRSLRAPPVAEPACKTAISLDLVLAALRNAFHTCYYCAVTTDHQEELQRKCIRHLRKPLSKATYDEYKAKMAESSAKVKEESAMQEDDDDVKPKEKEPSPEDRSKDTTAKEDDSREWKKSGTLSQLSDCCLS